MVNWVYENWLIKTKIQVNFHEKVVKSFQMMEFGKILALKEFIATDLHLRLLMEENAHEGHLEICALLIP